MSLRAVFLDVDDTLVDYQRAARAAFADALGSDDGFADFHGLIEYERYLSGELDFQTYRDERMAAFLQLRGRDSDVSRAADVEHERFTALERHYTLYDDVAPCLDVLRRRGLSIGLITNNESAHQRAKIASVGLDTLVDAVAISGEVGVAKPDARIFTHACAQLGVAPGAALHIGDNLEADAYGAHAAGLRAAWLDRSGDHDGTPLQFPVISSLGHLVDLLD